MRTIIINFQERISYYWVNIFWKRPHRLFSLKVTIAVTLLIVPFSLAEKAFFGITLALGAVAAALSETDDYPRGRIKALIITLFSFFISSASVTLLRPYPLLFGIGLVFSTFFFIIIGGMGERYRGITFGALLTAIYAMLGTYIPNPWYYQPILLPLGALCYGLVSLALLYLRPWRLLKEQLALGYRYLADYTEIKAKFFPSNPKRQNDLRNQLAQKNIQVVQAIGQCKNALKSYANEVKDHPTLHIYYQKWLLLQQMHERAASSHERYDILSRETENPQLIEGFGQLLLQISKALQNVSNALLTGIPYKHPIALSWTVNALKDMVSKSKEDTQFPSLSLLMKNLFELEYMLQTIDNHKSEAKMPASDYKSVPISTRLKKLLSVQHPRFRYAVRLSICFILGYSLIYFLKIEKGDWILLTSLFVCQQTYSETRQRLFQRVLGTLFGVVFGIIAASLLPTTTGQILLLIISVYAFFIWLRKKYAIAVIFITIFVLAAFNIQSNQGIAVMTPRVIDTLIGAFLAYLVVRFIWTDWQYKHLPQLLNDALDKNEKYLQAICTPEYEEVTYRNARQASHEADTALTLAWRGIKVEPHNKQFIEKQAFTLTYLNHTLLSYLSALGAHLQNKQMQEEEILICIKIGTILKNAQLTLSSNSSQKHFEKRLEEAEQWQKDFSKIKEQSSNERTVLLHNIIRVAKELLEKASHLKKNE